jgi:hypothetical protein
MACTGRTAHCLRFLQQWWCWRLKSSGKKVKVFWKWHCVVGQVVSSILKALQCCKTSWTAWPNDTELHPIGLLIMSFTCTVIQIQMCWIWRDRTIIFQILCDIYWKWCLLNNCSGNEEWFLQYIQNFPLEEATKAQRANRGIAVLFF